jgi:hypothetical protein
MPPINKTNYEKGVKDLGGKELAREKHPWEFAQLKKDYAENLKNGAPKINMLRSAEEIEDEAKTRKIPHTPSK